MSNKMSKRKKTELRKKRSQAKIKKMESQDSKGISRRKLTGAMNPKAFVILKVISIVSIAVSYFIFSPLLIFCVIFTILMFVFSTRTEKYLNYSYIKSNHIKFLKLDSVIAVIVLIVSIFSFALSFNSKKKTPRGNTLTNIVMNINNFCSLQTGQRSLIKIGGMKMKFSNVDFPEGMGPPPNGGQGPKFNLEDLPVEAVFSQMLSSINSVLIIMIPISGCITLIHYYNKKKKFDAKMNELITDEFANLDEIDLNKIFMFGYKES